MINYKDIEFLPIDLPKIDIPSTLRSVRIGDEWRWWNFTRLTLKTPNYGISPWLDIPEWKWLRSWITDHLPIDRVVHVKVNRQLCPTDPHIDFVNPEHNVDLYQHNNSIEPCGYRIVLTGRRDGLLVGDNKHTYLPEETNVYCIRHTETVHQTLPDDNRMMVFVHAWMDTERHYRILEQSVKRYEKYIVFRK